MQQGGSAGRRVRPMPLIRGGLAVLVALGIVGVVAIPSLRTMVLDGVPAIVDQVRRLVAPTLEIVHPIEATATSETADHGARRMIDTFTNTDWQSAEASPTITVRFQEPIDLGAVYVHSGSAEQFVDLRRPSKLEFVFPDGSSREIDLADEHDPQRFEISASAIEELTIRVVGTLGPADAPVALSEVEFFRVR
jgi:hypothetical protein